MKAPVSRCKAVCAYPTGRMASIPLRRAETRRWPPCGRCWANALSNPAFPSVANGRRAKEGHPRMPDLKARRASRINAGVTSDARQVTSARSADRFKGFPAGLLTGVCFRSTALIAVCPDEWRGTAAGMILPIGYCPEPAPSRPLFTIQYWKIRSSSADHRLVSQPPPSR